MTYMGEQRIAALLTCHNRCNTTLDCLDSLFQNRLPEGHSLTVFLVDDGSTDGTAASVRKRFPNVSVILGDGNLYWNGGMRLAFATAMRNTFDYYLWLNDDVILYKNTLSQLLDTAGSVVAYSIIVGTTQGRQGAAATYGGLVRISQWHPFKYRTMQAGNAPLACDTMNGNCVLVPCEVANKLGNLDTAYIHTMGDIDYGLRAKSAGFSVFIMPGYAGQCDRHLPGVSPNRSDGIFERYHKLLGKKGLPLKAWYVFTRRHGGRFWMVFWLWPSVKIPLCATKTAITSWWKDVLSVMRNIA
jgi:GT2 family glycosyltransferase